MGVSCTQEVNVSVDPILVNLHTPEGEKRVTEYYKKHFANKGKTLDKQTAKGVFYYEESKGNEEKVADGDTVHATYTAWWIYGTGQPDIKDTNDAIVDTIIHVADSLWEWSEILSVSSKGTHLIALVPSKINPSRLQQGVFNISGQYRAYGNRYHYYYSYIAPYSPVVFEVKIDKILRH